MADSPIIQFCVNLILISFQSSLADAVFSPNISSREIIFVKFCIQVSTVSEPALLIEDRIFLIDFWH